MICAMTARRVSAGKAEEFIDTFVGGADEMPPDIREKFEGVYACQDVNDPDVVLTFGLFNGTIEELRALQSRDERAEQLENVDQLIEDILIDSSFEVIRSMSPKELSGRSI